MIGPKLRRRLRQNPAARATYNFALRAMRGLRHVFDREPTKLTTYLGHEFSYPRDSAIGRHVARHGDWDAILARIVEKAFPEDEPFICEVGSNLGASLLQILRGKPRAKVLALEPSDEFRPFLERNLKAAGQDQVRVLPLFAGAAAGTTWLYNNETTASAMAPAYADHEPRGRQEVRVHPLDEILGSEPSVDFIKIDTDGFDFEVLKGAQRILRACRPLLFFELAPQLTTDCTGHLRALAELGYERFVCITPGQHAAVRGVTADPGQAVAWASESGYCDVLTWNSGDANSEGRFAGLEREL
jgi:FkbM family methyltransferase